MSATIAWLYAPADRPDLFGKALAAADGLIIDLEDSVHPASRGQARLNLVRLAELQPSKPVAVRVNRTDSQDFALDVAAVAPLVASGIVQILRLPKVESTEDVRVADEATAGWSVERLLTCQLETAQGVASAYQVARHPRVGAIVLGEADLRADLGLPRGSDGDAGLQLARQTVVLASRAAGLPSPSGSVHTLLGDVHGLRSSSIVLKELGFLGRSCIHPSQVAVVREAFRPSAEDLDWARSVIAAASSSSENGSAATTLADGSFVDPAIVLQAELIVEREGAQRP